MQMMAGLLTLARQAGVVSELRRELRRLDMQRHNSNVVASMVWIEDAVGGDLLSCAICGELEARVRSRESEHGRVCRDCAEDWQ